MKIPRNSKCTCGSGLMYKHCCGLGNPITGNSMSFISPERQNVTDFERAVKEYTGHYPDDYIKPITVISSIFNILIDESRLHNYYAVSGIIIAKDELERKVDLHSVLNRMAENYNVDYFHFTEIFGRSRVLGNRTADFIEEYSEVISKLEMFPFSICKTREEVEAFHNQQGMKDEEIFISLQWQLIFEIFKFLALKFDINLIIHMWREQENITTDKRLLHQKNTIDLLNTIPFANISIYRHYEIFMKKEILSSSLADLVAYFTTRIQSKKDIMSEKKLLRDNYEILKLVSKVFKEYKFIDVENLDKYVGEILKREHYRNNKRDNNHVENL